MLSHCGVYDVVECVELLWVVEYDLCELWAVDVSVGVYYVFSPCVYELLSYGGGFHNELGLGVGVVDGVLHDAQYV